jgi:hypothetical protein
MSPSGVVMMRVTKGEAGWDVCVATMLAANSNSFALVVVTDPLLLWLLLPTAAEVTSSGLSASRPEYSRIRTSTKVAAALNRTVTVLFPPITFLA